jgi:hypothetical protein
MQYFRFENTDKTREQALKEQYKTLSGVEKRLVRKEKRWRNFALTVTLLLFFGLIGASICLLIWIPDPNGVIWEILAIVGKIALGFLLFLISLFLLAVCVTPLWNKVESMQLSSIKKEFFSNACKHLRDYYQLQEPCIVTKCFDSTDEKFKNHDVCIFVVGDELRITADLIRGFLHGERDLGCYAFKQEEIALTKKQNEKQLILELKAGDALFLLGYRAKTFIEKNFINNTTPKEEY